MGLDEPGPPSPRHLLSSNARFIVLFGPPGFADHVPGLPGPPEHGRRLPGDAASLLGDLGSEALDLVVVDHGSASILPALRPGRTGAGPAGLRPAPVVVVNCPDAAAVEHALATGAEMALRADASAAEIASACRAGIDLHQLSRLSLKDDLTAAWNRRYFETCLASALERAAQQREQLSLIFMDIDNLKAVNAQHGHSMGSHVLREVATRLLGAVRGTDAVMRYGGDEFCILLPGLDLQAALEVAERLRAAVASQPFDILPAGQVSLTASFGVATYPEHASDLAGLVAAADGAMIAIKDRQKNGIRVAGAA